MSPELPSSFWFGVCVGLPLGAWILLMVGAAREAVITTRRAKDRPRED